MVHELVIRSIAHTLVLFNTVLAPAWIIQKPSAPATLINDPAQVTNSMAIYRTTERFAPVTPYA